MRLSVVAWLEAILSYSGVPLSHDHEPEASSVRKVGAGGGLLEEVCLSCGRKGAPYHPITQSSTSTLRLPKPEGTHLDWRMADT